MERSIRSGEPHDQAAGGKLGPARTDRDADRRSAATWFTYLSILVFVSVSLIGVDDADFFACSRTVDLPVVGVSVPVALFFITGAILVTTVHGYLHVFLEEMWIVLARAPSRLPDGRALASAIPPWLVSDFALHLRARIRPDEPPAIVKTSLGLLGAAVSFLLLYCAAPLLLFWLWLWSQPAHLGWLTVAIGLMGWGAASVTSMSVAGLLRRLNSCPPRARGVVEAAAAGALVVIIAVSLARTVWDPLGPGVTRNPREVTVAKTVLNWFRPATIDLRARHVSRLTPDWLPHDEAVAAFRIDWCARTGRTPCNANTLEDAAFREAYRAHRERWLAVLEKPSLDGRNMDHADLVRAFLPGVTMTDTSLRRADLDRAQIEGVVAARVDLTAAVLLSSEAAFATFTRARLDGANMNGMSAVGARFILASITGVNLSNGDFGHALFNVADLSRASLREARLDHAFFHRARLIGADLREARLEGAELVQADLSGAWIEAARLGRLEISSTIFRDAYLSWLLMEDTGGFWFGKTDFTGAKLFGVAFRNADMGSAIFSASEQLGFVFGDGSVILPEEMARPCHWSNEVLGDVEFHARWRGLVEAMTFKRSWSTYAPVAFAEVVPVAPPPGCRIAEITHNDMSDWTRAFQLSRTSGE